MGRYRLVFKQSAAKDLRDLTKKAIARLLECFAALSEDPRVPGCEKLSEQERYQVRRGAYRIVYEIEDDMLLVVVVKVGHRREVYRGRWKGITSSKI